MKEIELDLHNINTQINLHFYLKNKFGFPDFYEGNINALIDCLSGLRYPDEGMISIALGMDEVLLLKIKGVSRLSDELVFELLGAIEAVNNRQLDKGLSPSIYLLLIKN